ncbi:hypothetical protein ACFWY6_32150 [Streptomyces sp. NPDC059037]|uniref:hypothetical protein n=1 Tax=Streptomyces sp. NPDC059037 TaxID=3346710 RepID=UPI0036C6C70C
MHSETEPNTPWRKMPAPVPKKAAYEISVAGPVAHQISDTHDIQLGLAARLIRPMLHDLITNGTWFKAHGEYMLQDRDCHTFYWSNELSHVRLYQGGHSDRQCTRSFKPVRAGVGSWFPHFNDRVPPPDSARHIWRAVLRRAAVLDLTVLRPALDYYARLRFHYAGLTADNLATLFFAMADSAPHGPGAVDKNKLPAHQGPARTALADRPAHRPQPEAVRLRRPTVPRPIRRPLLQAARKQGGLVRVPRFPSPFPFGRPAVTVSKLRAASSKGPSTAGRNPPGRNVPKAPPSPSTTPSRDGDPDVAPRQVGRWSPPREEPSPTSASHAPTEMDSGVFPAWPTSRACDVFGPPSVSSPARHNYSNADPGTADQHDQMEQELVCPSI